MIERNHFLLVAERSVMPVIDLTVESLERHGHPATITLVVPDQQIPEFMCSMAARHRIVSESQVLPAWSLDKVAGMLGPMAHRAGWYLQQFLKLEWSKLADSERYVIWDADTVLLKEIRFWEDGHVMMGCSREHHQPYFDTYKRILAKPVVLKKSAIAQYMPIDCALVAQMLAEIGDGGAGGWVDSILNSLPLDSVSEFSEYETYANFVEHTRPGYLRQVPVRWFRYWSYLEADPRKKSLRELMENFDGYAYIAYERHEASAMRRIAAHVMHALRL